MTRLSLTFSCVRARSQMAQLIQEYSLPVVQAYMGHIMHAAENAVRDMLVRFSRKKGLGEVHPSRAWLVVDLAAVL